MIVYNAVIATLLTLFVRTVVTVRGGFAVAVGRCMVNVVWWVGSRCHAVDWQSSVSGVCVAILRSGRAAIVVWWDSLVLSRCGRCCAVVWLTLLCSERAVARCNRLTTSTNS